MRVVVVGGSGGIGRILLQGLLAMEPRPEIFVISLPESAVRATIAEFGGKVKGYAVDITDYGAIKDVLAKIGRFEALINCAGILGPVASLEETNMADWEKTIRVNLIGTVNCCKAAIPILKRAKRGKIINFAGGGAAFPRSYHSAYASSKAAVVRFTETLAQDFSHDRIRIDVNAVAPGAYNTDIWKTETFDKPPEEWADPSQLVRLVQFLLSKRSDGISGRLLHIKDDYEKRIDSPDLYTLRRIDNFRFRMV